MRKLERIAVLDSQANQLRLENDQLAKTANKLRSQVYHLKQELRWHINNGCSLRDRAQAESIDQPDSNSHLQLPVTMDKATETSLNNAQFELYDNSPDSTTNSNSSATATVIKKEPGFEQPGQTCEVLRRSI